MEEKFFSKGQKIRMTPKAEHAFRYDIDKGWPTTGTSMTTTIQGRTVKVRLDGQTNGTYFAVSFWEAVP